MKIITLTVLGLMIGFSSFAQKTAKKLPPISKLPEVGEKKVFHELDAEYDYKLYDSKGKLVMEGHDQFIDVTDLSLGNYVIVYNNKKELVKRTE